MNIVQLATFIRRKTRTTTGTYPDSELLIDLNVFIEEIAGRIQRFRPEVWNIPAEFNLVEDTREYAFPEDVLNSIVSLQLKFGDKWVTATALKKAPKHPLDEDTIVDNYSNEYPKFFIRRKAIFILSGEIENVADGGQLIYNAFPAEVTDIAETTDLSVDPSTTSHGFPREFHELLARRVSIHYKDINQEPLMRDEQIYEQDLEKALEEYGLAIQDLDEIINMPAGYTMWGNGYDL